MQDEEKSYYQTAFEQLDDVPRKSTQQSGLSSVAAQEGMVLQLADGGIQACHASNERLIVFTSTDITEDKRVQDEGDSPSGRQQRTVLIVDDCPEDRETYRRYLQGCTEYRYTIVEAELGEEGLEQCQRCKPDAVLLDYLLPDLDGLEFLAQLQQACENHPLVIVLTGQGNEFVAVQAMKAGACDYMVKGRTTRKELQLAVNGAIEKAQLRAQLQQAQAARQQLEQRERLVMQIAQRIRQTLNLEEILNTTVSEVRQFLQTERVFIYRFRPDWSGVVVVESVGDGWLSILNAFVKDTYFVETHGEDYRQGRIQATTDTYTAGLTQCHLDLLAQFQIRANLAVPILQGEALWGLLVANQCSKPRQWQPLEIDLLKQLATQVAIAIRQSELYNQAQIELAERKQAEAEKELLLQREQAARAEAEAANRIKDEFLAIVSHELRSPLNPILGWSKLLTSRKFSEAKTAEALAIIERNAKLQAQLIEDLLDVSRILRGKLSLNVSPVSLVSTISAALETVRLTAEAKSIQIQSVFDANVGQVSGDSNRLQQIVWNLLSNAVKFTPSGGQVKVHLERVGTQAQIQVSDTGKGISPDFLPYIFDSFRQESSATTRKFGGLGLGLAIVRNLVELHGGTVKAESLGVGQGATFTVRLPLMTIHHQTKDSTLPEPSLDLSGIHVLVVDDDADSLELVAFVLEQYGADVTPAASAGEALAAIAQSKPDVLVSDIGMPEIDGYMLMRQIRAMPPEQGGEIPAIALTAYAGEFDQQQALRAGFGRHLAKPVEPAELVAALARLAGKKQ